MTSAYLQRNSIFTQPGPRSYLGLIKLFTMHAMLMLTFFPVLDCASIPACLLVSVLPKERSFPTAVWLL